MKITEERIAQIMDDVEVRGGARFTDCDKAYMIGTIEKEPTFSHEMFGEKFYSTRVITKRTSGVLDYVPIQISERLIDLKTLKEGLKVEIAGQFRSYNHKEDANRKKLELYVFVTFLQVIDEEDVQSENIVYLDGFLCKAPNYRSTPRGREISDILLAVNRIYGKSDYIPAIAWGRNARCLSNLTVGSRIQVLGRIQSRAYQKVLSETEREERIAYEVSISTMNVVEDEK